MLAKKQIKPTTIPFALALIRRFIILTGWKLIMGLLNARSSWTPMEGDMRTGYLLSDYIFSQGFYRR